MLSPLPRLAPASDYREEFTLAGQLIAHARKEFLNRSDMYQPTLHDECLRLGLSLGVSVAEACSILVKTDPFWCCVCARPFLEYALRILWASREPDGIARMYSYYAKHHQEGIEKLAKNNSEFKPMLDDMDSAAPLSALPEPKMPDLRGLISQIGARDLSEQVPTLHADPSDYDETVAFLHNYLHANPLLLGAEADEYIPHAAHAVVNGTNALLRALGYRMNWDQRSIVCRVFGISCFSGLSVEQRAELRKALESA